MLEDLTDGVDLRNGELVVAAIYSHTYTYLLANLLVDDNIHQRARRSNALVGSDEVLERQRADQLLDVGLTASRCES